MVSRVNLETPTSSSTSTSPAASNSPPTLSALLAISGPAPLDPRSRALARCWGRTWRRAGISSVNSVSSPPRPQGDGFADVTVAKKKQPTAPWRFWSHRPVRERHGGALVALRPSLMVGLQACAGLFLPPSPNSLSSSPLVVPHTPPTTTSSRPTTIVRHDSQDQSQPPEMPVDNPDKYHPRYPTVDCPTTFDECFGHISLDTIEKPKNGFEFGPGNIGVHSNY